MRILIHNVSIGPVQMRKYTDIVGGIEENRLTVTLIHRQHTLESYHFQTKQVKLG